MPEEQVQLVGADEAMRDLARWAKELGPEIVKQSHDFAEDIARRVADSVPVLTGTLAASVEVVDADQGEDGFGVSIGDGVDYAGWIEFGGTRSRPYFPEGRYLYPIAVDAGPDFIQAATDISIDTVGSFAWSTPST